MYSDAQHRTKLVERFSKQLKRMSLGETKVSPKGHTCKEDNQAFSITRSHLPTQLYTRPNNWRSKWACVQCKASSTRGTRRNVIHCCLSAIMHKQVFDEYEWGMVIGQRALLNHHPSDHKGVLGVWRFISRRGCLLNIDIEGDSKPLEGRTHILYVHTHTCTQWQVISKLNELLIQRQEITPLHMQAKDRQVQGTCGFMSS